MFIDKTKINKKRPENAHLKNEFKKQILVLCSYAEMETLWLAKEVTSPDWAIQSEFSFALLKFRYDISWKIKILAAVMISICLVKHVQLRTFLQIVIKSQCQNLWKQLTQTFPREWRTWTVDRYKPKFGHLRWILFAPNSVTRLRDFWKFLATKFLTKVAKMKGNFLCNFAKPHTLL